MSLGGSDPNAVVLVTSPAYFQLCKTLRGKCRIVYYCADDYSSHAGWGGASVLDRERELMRACSAYIFVSEALKDRAVRIMGVDEALALVSPNATEERFLRATAGHVDITMKRGISVGVLGNLSNRLDLDLIARVADLDCVNVVEVAGELTSGTPWSGHAKVKITGRVPHSEMHVYALAHRVALIPYRRTPLNFLCSPMRLFDHVAAGASVFATDACDQINRIEHESVVCLPSKDLAERLREFGRTAVPPEEWVPKRFTEELFWSHRAKRVVEFIREVIR
jgi:hypothetical protein